MNPFLRCTLCWHRHPRCVGLTCCCCIRWSESVELGEVQINFSSLFSSV